MVKHMIIWKLRPDVDDPKARIADIKSSLEALVGVIDGLTEMKILTESLPSSTGDVMMDSTFTTPEALDAYKEHPAHLAVANSKVRPFVEKRLAFDYKY